MSDLIVTSFVGSGDNKPLLFATSANGAAGATNWCAANTGQFSSAAPALTSSNGDLWCAFRGKNLTDVFVASLGNWADNIPTGQSSQLAPAITADQAGNLWVAYVDEASGEIDLVSSSDGAGTGWSASPFHTGQATLLAPAIAASGGVLFVAFAASASGNVMVAASADGGTNWSVSGTGQSSTCTPAITTDQAGTLWAAYVDAVSGEVDLVSSTDGTGSSWSASPYHSGQQSQHAPAITEYDGALWVAYVDPATSQILLISPGSDWATTTLSDTDQVSQSAPALAVVPAAPMPAGGLGGDSQYVFCGSAALLDFKIEIVITEPIVVSPHSSVTPSTPLPLPAGFQINGAPPQTDEADSFIYWQQYGVKMWPGSKSLQSFAEAWTKTSNQNLYDLSSYPNQVLLPNDLTIPAQWIIRISFKQLTDGTITELHCSVVDDAGVSQGPDLNIPLSGKPLAATGAGNIGASDMAPIQNFQGLLVGFWSSADATLVSGAGTMTFSSSTPMTPLDSGDTRTAENSNSAYSQVPAQASNSITQAFYIQPADVFPGPGGHGLGAEGGLVPTIIIEEPGGRVEVIPGDEPGVTVVYGEEFPGDGNDHRARS